MIELKPSIDAYGGQVNIVGVKRPNPMIRIAQAARRPNFSAVVVKSKLAPASRLTNWLSIAFSLASSAAMRASYACTASWSTSLMRSGDPGHRMVAAFGDRFLVELRARQLYH